MLTANHLYDITGTLTPRPPFDFGKSLSFLHGFGPTAGEQSLAGASLTKAVTLHGHTVAFEVQNEGTIEEPRLAYRLYSEQPLSEEDRAAIADRIRFFLSLDDNLQPFYIIGQADPQSS
jgi:DNA-3-methyladenine glycosylase II